MTEPSARLPADADPTGDRKRAAFYARVTNEKSRQGMSIPNQIRRFNEIADREGWQPLIYEEKRAVKGQLRPEARPALAQLLADGQAGLFDIAVMRHLDRIARGDLLTPILVQLQSLGIEIRTFDGPVDVRSAAGRFQVRVQAAAGAFETERGGERIRESKRSRFLQGIYVGRAPYGWTNQARVRSELVAAGMDKDQARIEAQKRIPVSPGLVLDPEESAVVEEIFRRYGDERHGARVIREDLDRRGLTKRGQPWTDTALRKVLRDPKYAGWVTFDDAAFEAKTPSAAPKHQQRLHKGQHEAIVNEVLWRKVQRRLDTNARKLDQARSNARIYPLSQVATCPAGHPMKGNRSDTRASYRCNVRARRGPDPARGGCDALLVNAEQMEQAVREVLAALLSSPAKVHRLLEEANRKLAEASPQRRAEVVQVEEEIQSVRQQREAAYRMLDKALDSPAHQRELMDRVVELAAEVKRLQQAKAEIEAKVVPLRPLPLTKRQVAAYLSGIRDGLTDDLAGLRSVVGVLADRHGLRVEAIDRYRVRVVLALDAGSIGDGKGTAEVSATAMPRALLTADGKLADRVLTGEEWASRENETGHFCACGCGEQITVLPRHRAPTVGIPRFKHGKGHHKMDMTDFVEALNDDGFWTVAQAAKEIGCGENTLRRAEAKGWVVPEWRTWGDRQPMRVYAQVDIPKLKEQMVQAGFWFADDGDLMTTREMAEALGTSETHLRHLQKKGVIDPPERDTANKRRWKRADIPRFKKALAKYRKDWLAARSGA